MIVWGELEKRRNYRQFCGLARALDRVGERWTLLIVRNLLLGPKRYSDLLEGLPGITTNVLREQLRQMMADDLVTRDARDTSARGVVRYRMTPHGQSLGPVFESLWRWGRGHLQHPRAAGGTRASPPARVGA